MEREELHKLLDRMLDEGEEVGDISHMTMLDQGLIKIKNIRIIIKASEYTTI